MNYTAIPDSELEVHELHQDFVGHALSAVGWVIFLMVISSVILGLWVWQLSVGWWQPGFWMASLAIAFCLWLNFMVMVSWWDGLQHLRSRRKQFTLDCEHRRGLELKQHTLQSRKLGVLARSPVAERVLDQSRFFGLDKGRPNQVALVRVETRPPEAFLVWLWTEGHQVRGDQRVVWGEERIIKRWGDKADQWLADLATIGAIAGRDRDRRLPGSLAWEEADVLGYFDYLGPTTGSEGSR